MNQIPKRRRKPRMLHKDETVIRCPSHLQWVRGANCIAYNRDAKFPCQGNIEAHHVKTRGAGGGDEQVVPICQFHHTQLDSPGWSSKRFDEYYRLSQADTAVALWKVSPHGIKYRTRMEGDR